MYAAEKSDIGILPVKVPNKVGKPTAEVLEGRSDDKGNLFETDKYCPQWQGVDMVNSKWAQRENPGYGQAGSTYVEPEDLLSGLERVREAAISASALPPEVGAG